MITSEVIQSIDGSVLCWLATVSEDGSPNVSPKEAFLSDGEGMILVANIASPITEKNIESNENVCLSFVNVFIQRGFKVKGRARIVRPGSDGYESQHAKLVERIGSAFPIISVIEIVPDRITEIVAPSYHLFPDSGPLDRIRESLETYRVASYQKRAKQNDPASGERFR